MLTLRRTRVKEWRLILFCRIINCDYSCSKYPDGSHANSQVATSSMLPQPLDPSHPLPVLQLSFALSLLSSLCRDEAWNAGVGGSSSSSRTSLVFKPRLLAVQLSYSHQGVRREPKVLCGTSLHTKGCAGSGTRNKHVTMWGHQL